MKRVTSSWKMIYNLSSLSTW